MITVSFHRLAARELSATYDWYAARDREVAERFVHAVTSAVERIANDPDTQAIEYKEIRWVKVRRFPYRLIFEHKESGRALVLAVVHSSRRPRYWRRRKR